MKNSTSYRKNGSYRFSFASGGSESATYLGKNRQGMHQFAFATGEVWTGFVAPVFVEEWT